MLRITTIATPDVGPTLKLEGKLLEPWVGELMEACQTQPGAPLQLDLAAVSFVDPAGMKALRDLLRQGIRVAACSGFVAELLHGEMR